MMNSPQEEHLRFGLYCRKSSDSEDKQVQSNETQERELVTFADKMDLDVQNIWREEKSAFKTGREYFANVVKAINANEINSVLVVHPNRLARNPIDAASIVDAMDRGKLLCVRTPSKTYFNNSIDKMVLGLEFLFSKRDSDDKSVFVKNGQKTKAIKGYPHGIAALGFLNDKTEEKGNRKWLVDELRFPLIEKILHMFLTGAWSANKVAAYARNELKLTTPKHKRSGGALVTVSRVHQLLKDSIYAGFFYQGGHRYQLNSGLPRIITEDQHHTILRMLSDRTSPKTKTHIMTYSGFIRSPRGEFIGADVKFQLICDCKYKFSYSNREKCPNCGNAIADLLAPKYLQYKYYYNVARRKQSLSAKSVREEVLDRYLIAYFVDNILSSPELVRWSKEHLAEMKSQEEAVADVLESQAHQNVELAKKRKKKIIQMIADETISGEDGKVALHEINQSIATGVHQNVSQAWYDTAVDMADLSGGFVEVMNSNEVTSKRKVLSRFGSNLTWNEEKLSIINTKWINILIEGLKEAKTLNPRFEPRNIVDTSRSNEDFASVRPTLLRTWDNVRKAIIDPSSACEN